MKKLMMIMAMVAVIALANSAMAAPHNFTNNTPGALWGTAGNWDVSPPTLPDIAGGETCNVGGVTSPTDAGVVQMNFTGTGLAALNITTSGTLTLGGLFAYANPNPSVVTQTSGTLHVGTSLGFRFGGYSPTGSGTATYNMNGGILQNDGWTFFGRDANNTGSFIQTAGAATFGNGGAGDYFHIDSGAGDVGTGLYEISGGSMTINTAGEIGIGYNASVDADAGAGTFRVDGSVAGGGPTAITWTGTANVGGGGTNQGELEFIMDALGVTPITLNGALNLISSPLLTVDMSGLGPGVGNIPLILNDGGDAIVGTFSGLAEGAPVGTYTLSYIGGDGNDLVLVGSSGAPVPEPAGLGLIGLALLAVRRRRS
ncbi:MAG: hypothetical protein ABII82_02160 [Verrucomicrobiota bacterium]